MAPKIHRRDLRRTYGGMAAILAFAVASLCAVVPPAGFGVGPPSPSQAHPTVAGVADNLSVTGASPGAISLSWPASTDLLFTNYDVEQSTAGASGPWVSLATPTPVSATTFFWAGLLPGQTYWWRVLYNSTVSSSSSSVAQATQPPVSHLTISLSGPTKLALAWTNSANYSGNIRFLWYAIFESSGTNGTPQLLANLSSPQTLGYPVGNLTPSTSYQYYVETADGCSGAANCATSPTESTSRSNSAAATTPGQLSASASASSTSVTAGAAVNFTCQASGGVPPYRFSWTFGDGSRSNGRHVALVYYVAGTYSVDCIVDDFLGTTANASVTVVVQAVPSGGGGGGGQPNGTPNGSGAPNGTNPNGSGIPPTHHTPPATGHPPATGSPPSAATTWGSVPVLLGLLGAIVLACLVLLLLLTPQRARRSRVVPAALPGHLTSPLPSALVGTKSPGRPPTPISSVPSPVGQPPSPVPPPATPEPSTRPPASAPPAGASRPPGGGLDMDRIMDDLETAVQHARKRGLGRSRWW